MRQAVHIVRHVRGKTVRRSLAQAGGDVPVEVSRLDFLVYLRLRCRIRHGLLGLLNGGRSGNLGGRRLLERDGVIRFFWPRTRRATGVDAVATFHVLIVVGPVREMVLALVAGVRPLPSVLPSVRLRNKQKIVMKSRREKEFEPLDMGRKMCK